MRMPRPRIGICAAIEQARWGAWDREAHLSQRSYVDRVHDAGGLALLLPITEDEPEELLDQVDALLLAGGADIDPSAYGAARHPCTVDTSPARDRFEIALARAAVERDLPVLGVCRGMQLLNVALGGTLIQHLPDDVGHEDHRRTLGSFDNSDHDVRVAPGSLAARVIGEAVHKTYSHHHQAVATLGAGLVASGWATIDDLAEVVELPGKRFVLGVQWHPEVDETSPVIAGLVDACRSAEVSVGDASV
jgi:putative glutamine amidotransferase